MLSAGCERELQTYWFPNLSDSGLNRLIELIRDGSPLLVHGCFSKAMPMGCLATHAAWHHPRTRHLMQDAGIMWLTRVAGLNPATSLVVREWDGRACPDWEVRDDLLGAFLAEQHRRERAVEPAPELQAV